MPYIYQCAECNRRQIELPDFKGDEIAYNCPCESRRYVYIGQKTINGEFIAVEKKIESHPKITFFSDEENKSLREDSFTNVSCRPRGSIDVSQLEAASKIIDSESDQKKSKKMEAQFGCKHPGSLISFGQTRLLFLELAKSHLQYAAYILSKTEQVWVSMQSMLRNISSGPAFTSKKDNEGKIIVKDRELETLIENCNNFFGITKILKRQSTNIISQNPNCTFTIYRVLHSNIVKEKNVDTIHTEIIPFSGTHNLCWAVKNWVKTDFPCIFEIEVPIDFDMIICSYPEQYVENLQNPQPLNQNQREIALAPMQLLITEKFVIEMEGKVITMFKTRLKAIPQNEVLQFLKK
jgi:hypothetical protein